jgi:hypothetical protein
MGLLEIGLDDQRWTQTPSTGIVAIKRSKVSPPRSTRDWLGHRSSIDCWAEPQRTTDPHERALESIVGPAQVETKDRGQLEQRYVLLALLLSLIARSLPNEEGR